MATKKGKDQDETAEVVAGLTIEEHERLFAGRRVDDVEEKMTGEGWTFDPTAPAGQQIKPLERTDPQKISVLAAQGVRARDYVPDYGARRSEADEIEYRESIGSPAGTGDVIVSTPTGSSGNTASGGTLNSDK